MNSGKPPLSNVFQSILSSEISAFIIVDHQAAFAQCFSASGIASSELGVVTLTTAARKLGVPVIVSVVETNRIRADLSPEIASVSGGINCLSRGVFNPWDDPAFSEAVELANRPKLIVAGLSAESSLTLTVLCALEQGFDVYVVRDACLGVSQETFEVSLERLKQAGAVIVSWRQIMIEWHQGNVDSGFLRRVMKQKNPL